MTHFFPKFNPNPFSIHSKHPKFINFDIVLITWPLQSSPLRLVPLSIFIHLFSLYFNPTYQNLVLSYTNKISTLLSNSLWIFTIFWLPLYFTSAKPSNKKSWSCSCFFFLFVFSSINIDLGSFFFFWLFIDRGTFYLELDKPLILWPKVKPNSQFNFPNLLTPNLLIFPYI